MVAEHWQAAPGLEAWLACVADVPPGDWEALYGQMDPLRRRRCRRYRRDEDKARCILADALARHTLHALTGAAPDAIRFSRSQRGKPWAPDLGVHFSLSHSGALVLCAAAPFPVGADIQRHRPVSDALLRRALAAGCAEPTPAAFFPWWVRQEAAGKLTGRGLSLSPLPPGLCFWDGETCRDGERYHFSICAHPGSFSPDP